MASGLDAILSVDQIRTMIAIAEQGSFNRAATILGVRQSGVNQLVGRIEERVGRRLFDRTATGVRLTIDGEAVLIYARAVSMLGEDLLRHLAASRVDTVLRIGLSDDFSRTALPAVLGIFMKQYPELRVEALSSLVSKTLFTALDRGDLDVVMTRRVPPDPRGEVLWRGPIAWVGRTDLPRPIGDPVSLVLGPLGSPSRTFMLSALQAASRSWRVAFEGSSLASMEAALQAGIGVAAGPVGMNLMSLAYLGDDAGLPVLGHTEFVYEKAEHRPSVVVDAFCEVLRTAARLSFAPSAGEHSLDAIQR